MIANQITLFTASSTACSCTSSSHTRHTEVSQSLAPAWRCIAHATTTLQKDGQPMLLETVRQTLNDWSSSPRWAAGSWYCARTHMHTAPVGLALHDWAHRPACMNNSSPLLTMVLRDANVQANTEKRANDQSLKVQCRTPQPSDKPGKRQLLRCECWR